MRIGVLDGLVAQDLARGFEVLDDHRVRVEDLQALVGSYQTRESPACLQRLHHLDAVRGRELHVLFTESRCEVDDSGTAVGGDVVTQQNTVRTLMTREKVEWRGVVHVLQFGTQVGPQNLGLRTQLTCVPAEQRGGEQVLLPVLPANVAVFELRIDGDGQVRRQCPWCGRPDQGFHPVERSRTGIAGTQGHSHRDSRILAHLVGVVELALLIRQRSLLVPGVRQHAVALVDQALVMERLERPHHRLHEVDVEGLVIVVEVDPSSLARHVLSPLVGVAQHRCAAVVVELCDAHGLDLGLVGDPELAFGLQFRRQAVGVPAEAAIDLLASHRLETRNEVFHVPGEEVAVVRQPVGKGGPVVEDELRRVGPVVDRRPERVVGLPVVEYSLLDLGKRRRSGLGSPGEIDQRVHASC